MKHGWMMVAAAVSVLVGCKQDTAVDAPPVDGRVNAVLASGKKSSFADLCDAAKEPPPPFVWPAIPDPIMATKATFRWMNVWATWCKPCVEELPLLKRTFDAWALKGQTVELTLLSVDADAEAARKFIAERPELPGSFQLHDASKAGDWLSQIGLPSGAAIPVHIVLDNKGKQLCARAGGVSEQNLEKFRQVMFP
jgi:thiol-disulfide isomerase/thioredoxin